MPACGVCTAPNTEAIEEVGTLCLRGELSWRKGAEQAGYHNYQAFKRHMENHYVSPADAAAAKTQDVLDEKLQLEIDKAAEELLHNMEIAPTELKPLFATAVHNLRHLTETKPSQQHLVAALKTIHEITGMRIEQQMMLQFAGHRFKEALPPADHSPVPALAAGNAVMEAEVVDEG